MRNVNPPIAHARRRDQLQIREAIKKRRGELCALAHGAYYRVWLQARNERVLVMERLVVHVNGQPVLDGRPVGGGEGDMLIIVEDRDASLC